jgi:4-amino-4-deoxy-L-arabinose transferase-like glycosyltransferase
VGRLSGWWRAGVAGVRARLPEIAVTVGALAFFGWGVSKNGYGQTYYAAAVRSMDGSWKNFLFGSFDPGGWITTDKPPLALWLESLSTRVFGFSSWSLFLPSVLCGAAAVWLLMSAVRSAWGRWAGVVAGVTLALTPVVVAVSRSDNPDATLLLCLVAAGYATQRAITRRRPAWLAVAALAVGLAFLTKLLVAGAVVPGIVVAYLLSGPGGWWRRVRDLGLAATVFLVIAAGWVALFDLTPASSRPYVANSTNNTAQDLIFGYNGFGRLTGSNGAGFGRLNLAGRGGPAGNAFGGTPGIGRLFNGGMGDQVMWLVVAAGVALIAGLAVAVRHRRRDAQTASLVIWGGIGIVSYFVFAYTQGTFHNYYVAAFAPAVAALVGTGFALVQRGGRTAAGWLAVGAIGTAAIEIVLLRRVPAYEALRVLVPVVLVAVAVVAVAFALFSPRLRQVIGALAGLALLTALLAPAAWAAAAVRHPATSTELTARPQTASTPQAGMGGRAGPGFGGFGRFGGRGLRTAAIPTAELTWLRRQHHGEQWILAVQNAREAAPMIISGDSVMAMGGFQGTDPAMTQAKLADLVQHHRLRFIAPGGIPQAKNQIAALVTQTCAPVDAAMWESNGPSTLYDCAGRAAAIRTAKVTATGRNAPGGFLLGRPQDVQRLVTCLQRHGWDPTSGPGPAFSKAIGACSRLVPAAVERASTTSNRPGPP